jgi:hypothetical protein
MNKYNELLNKIGPLRWLIDLNWKWNSWKRNWIIKFNVKKWGT